LKRTGERESIHGHYEGMAKQTLRANTGGPPTSRWGQQRRTGIEFSSDSQVQAGGFVDSFSSSCFVHIRKPDADIFRLALDIAQEPARQVVYIENTPIFVQIAEGLGIRSILHTDYRSTRARLAAFGLRLAKR
jgi:hypothetical protein